MLDQILRDQQSYYIDPERDLDVCTKFHGNPSKSCWHILHKISWFRRGKAREKVIMLHPDSHPTNQMSAQNAKCVAGCAAKVKGLPKASRNYPLGTINVCTRCHGNLSNSCQDISTKNCQVQKKKSIIRVTKIYPPGTMNIPSQFHGNLSDSCCHILHIIPCLAEEGSGKKWLCIILKDIQQWMSVINEFQLLG